MSQAISFRRRDSINSSSFNHHNNNGGIALSPRWRASPMSFKMGSLVGSLGTKLYSAPGCSPITSLESLDFRMPVGSIPSSIDQSRLIQALSSSTDGECSNYTCCGLPLTDLHALLDHFEESHVLVLDHHTLHHPEHQHQQPNLTPHVESLHEEMPLGSMELDNDMELEESPSGSGSSSTSSSASSPHLGPSLNLNANMNPYYADFRSLMAAGGAAGATPIVGGVAAPSSLETPSSTAGRVLQSKCIPPALLFSPVPSPAPSRPQSSSGVPPSATQTAPPSITDNSAGIPSGTETGSALNLVAGNSSEEASTSASIVHPLVTSSGTPIIHPGPPPPNSAPTSFNKPFKCPTPNCNKSYKQANGLKYHLQHGQCCFIPRDPALDGLDDIEKDKVERPFGCGVGGCERRYKNMNGLRYHYQHSGAHGVKGLELLNAGMHSVQLAAASASRAGKTGGPSRSSSVGHTRPNVNSMSPSPTSGSTTPPSGISRTASVGPSGISRTVGGMGQSTPTTPTQPGTHKQQPSTVLSPQSSVPPTSPTRPPPQTYAFPYAQYQAHLQQAVANGYANATNVTGRQPVYPPNHGVMTSTIAAMAGAFGALNGTMGMGMMPQQQQQPQPGMQQLPPQMQPFQSQPQRPHQLLRTNSSSAATPATGIPTISTSTVTVSSGNSPNSGSGVADMEMEMDEQDVNEDFRMEE